MILGLNWSVSLKTNFFHRIETVGSDNFGHGFDVDDVDDTAAAAGDVGRSDRHEMASAALMSCGTRDTFTEEEHDAHGRED